jgi:hypothetical protein
LNVIGCSELLHQFVTDVAVFGIGLTVFGKELDIVLFEPVMLLECPKELSAGQLIGKFIAAISRRDLFQDCVASKSDIEPSGSRQHRHWQKVIFTLTAFQLGRTNTDALAEAEKQRTVTWNVSRRAWKILIAHFGLDNVNELLVNRRIVDAG